VAAVPSGPSWTPPLTSELKKSQGISKNTGFSAVGIATGYGLDDRVVEVRLPVGAKILFLQVVQTGFGINPTSYPKGNGGSFPGGKAVRA
jgi:hypothetical protein